MTKNEKECIACKEPINRGAKKCIHCGSFQDWRKYFNVGTVVLSLLVALISVLTTAVPIIKSTFTPNRSDVRFSLLDYGSHQINVVSSNLGNRAAILKGAKLYLIRNGNKQNLPMSLMYEGKDSIIEPAKWHVFQFYGEVNGIRTDLPRQLTSDNSCKYYIEFDVIAFDHKPKRPYISCPCPE